MPQIAMIWKSKYKKSLKQKFRLFDTMIYESFTGY